jgi:chromosome segregation ATPase
MTIDERLERLTERHEALTQTVELMAAENRDHEARFNAELDRINRTFSEIGSRFNEINRTFSDLGAALTEITGSLSRLLQVAENHEQRLDRLERTQH